MSDTMSDENDWDVDLLGHGPLKLIEKRDGFGGADWMRCVTCGKEGIRMYMQNVLSCKGAPHRPTFPDADQIGAE